MSKTLPESYNSEGFLYQLISKLAPDPKKVEDWVKEVKKENPNLNNDQIAEYLSDYIVWQYTGQGVALGLPGAIPGLGTVAQIAIESGALSADIALMVRNQTYIVFALGYCYGIKGRETLIQDALLCMGLWTKALVLTKRGAVMIGTKILDSAFKKKFSADILKAINKKVGTTILTKYGTKRGGIAVGKLIPFGVGAVVGGGFNYITMKSFKNETTKYFSLKIK